jgi:hypothetical protein
MTDKETKNNDLGVPNLLKVNGISMAGVLGFGCHKV